MRIRSVTPDDLPAVRALNAANVPAVGPLDEDRVALFLDRAAAFWVVQDDAEAVVGLFVGLLGDLDYGSPNYRWFVERHPSVAYVDRIALAPAARGTGAADQCYDRWEDLGRAAGATVVCAEVNVVPPNPRSLAFHRRRAMLQVGELAPYGDEQRVAMLAKAL